MDSLNDEERASVQRDSQYQIKANRYAEEVVNNLLVKDIEDVYGVALKMVCRGRFFYTDAEKILSRIEEIQCITKGIDVREAALLSVCEYFFDYVADQIELKPE
jgi:hypothetical protein